MVMRTITARLEADERRWNFDWAPFVPSMDIFANVVVEGDRLGFIWKYLLFF